MSSVLSESDLRDEHARAFARLSLTPLQVLGFASAASGTERLLAISLQLLMHVSCLVVLGDTGRGSCTCLLAKRAPPAYERDTEAIQRAVGCTPTYAQAGWRLSKDDRYSALAEIWSCCSVSHTASDIHAQGTLYTCLEVAITCTIARFFFLVVWLLTACCCCSVSPLANLRPISVCWWRRLGAMARPTFFKWRTCRTYLCFHDASRCIHEHISIGIGMARCCLFRHQRKSACH